MRLVVGLVLFLGGGQCGLFDGRPDACGKRGTGADER